MAAADEGESIYLAPYGMPGTNRSPQTTLMGPREGRGWVDSVKELAMVAERYPQAAYAGLQKSLQQGWQFLQRVTEGLGDEFRDIEKALQKEFLPALSGDDLAGNIPG